MRSSKYAGRAFRLGFFLSVILLSFGERASAAPPPVFPGAEGYGTRSYGGSGRNLSPPSTTVYRVTSLSDSGKGTLRECVEGKTPRTCVFETSGKIKLLKELKVSYPYLTIAGQTAPSPGIMITGAGIRITTNDVLIRHLQVRVGDGSEGPSPQLRDGVNVAGQNGRVAYNVVLDHLSISWAVDENFDTWYDTTHDVTLCYSIVSEALHKSIHPRGAHSMGVLIGDRNKQITLHHNLLAHNYDRNPRIKSGATVDFVGNVIYNWGGTSGWNLANLSDTDGLKKPTLLNFVSNYYKPGPQSSQRAPLYGAPAPPRSLVYADGNIGPTRPADSGSEWLISSIAASPFQSKVPVFPLTAAQPSNTQSLYDLVLAKSGSRPKERNSADARVINEVKTKTGKLKDCVSGCKNSAGGYPSTPIVKKAFSLPADPNGDSNKNGYTNLEDYLNSLAQQLE
jgi:pectate lyase